MTGLLECKEVKPMRHSDVIRMILFRIDFT